MGFKEVKRQVLTCLNNGSVLHEARGNIDIKNMLSTGEISLNDIALIRGALYPLCQDSCRLFSSALIQIY